GGGGTSDRFSQPYYQRDVVPAALSGSQGGAPMRVVPDVSAVGDPFTGFLVGQSADPTSSSYDEQSIGGTSLSRPLFAGLQAAAQQGAGKPAGFANNALYDLYGTPAFHDVTDKPLGPHKQPAVVDAFVTDKGVPDFAALSTMGKDTSLSTVPGYDN